MKNVHGWLRWLVLIALAGAQIVTPVVAQAQTQTGGSMPAGLYSAFLDSTSQAATAFRQSGAGFALQAHGLRAQVDAGGLALAPTGGEGWNWGVQLDGFGRGAHPGAVSSPTMSAANGLVTYRYSGLSQWLRNTGIGIEQGFTIEQRPAGSGGLVLAMRLDSSLSGTLSADGRSLSFDAGNGQTLQYRDLRVLDANGKELAASLSYSPQQIAIQLDDQNAVYPLTVDPLIYLESKQMASDGAAGDIFGYSVAISGNTAIVGARHHQYVGVNLHQGSAYIFVRSGSLWSQQARLTTSDGANGDNFGTAVAISGDTVIVGAPYKDVGPNPSQGAAYVFVKPAGGWADMQETAKLTASDGAQYDVFGFSVAISGDTAIIGAYSSGGNMASPGAAYVFAKPGSGWANARETAKLTASDGAVGDQFGYSVAISGDTAIVGAPLAKVNANPGQGAAYVFVMPASGWATTSETAKLSASDGAVGDDFGNSVAISGDTAIVGAPNASVGSINTHQGAAYVYVKPGSVWVDASENAKLSASDGANGNSFGFSVAISGDTAIVGAVYVDANANPSQGAAYVFLMPSGGWTNTRETAKLNASDGTSAENIGWSVATSAGTVIVGAPFDDVGTNIDQGSVYFYQANYDLGVGAAVDKTKILPGEPLTVTISASNYASTASAVVVNASIPGGFTYNGSNATQGTYDPATGVWSLGTLETSITATLSLQVTARNAIAGRTRAFTVSTPNTDNNSSNNTASVTVKVSPLKLAPLAVLFGDTFVGMRSPARMVTVTNLGAVALRLGTLSASAGFALLNNTCNGRLLAHNASCTFKVQFRPTVVKGYTGKVNIPHNGLGGASSLTLSGTGSDITTVLQDSGSWGTLADTVFHGTDSPGFATSSARTRKE
jgi:hypothetical protein